MEPSCAIMSTGGSRAWLSTNHMPAACEVQHGPFNTWDMSCHTASEVCNTHHVHVTCCTWCVWMWWRGQGGIAHRVLISQTLGQVFFFIHEVPRKASWKLTLLQSRILYCFALDSARYLSICLSDSCLQMLAALASDWRHVAFVLSGRIHRGSLFCFVGTD